MKQKTTTIFLSMLAFLIISISSSRGTTIYYSQVSNGGNRDATILTSWNSSSTGGGITPSNFTSGDEFHIINGDSMVASGMWTVSGSGGKLIIEANGKFNASGFDHSLKLDLLSGAYYYVSSSYANLLFGSININSNFYLNFITGGSTTFLRYLTYGCNLYLNNQRNTATNIYFSNTINVSGDLNLLGNGLNKYYIFNATKTFNFNKKLYIKNSVLNCASTVAPITNVGSDMVITNGGRFVACQGATNPIFNITGSLILNSGYFTGVSNASGNPQFNIGKDFIQTAGSFVAQSSSSTGIMTMTFNSGNGNISVNNITNSNYYIIINGTISLSSNFSIGKNLTINAGNQLLANSNTLTVAGDWINNGTFTPGTGTVSFVGITAISGSTVAHNFNNVSVAAGATLTAPSANMNVGGNFTSSGIFNHNNGTITLNGIAQNFNGLTYNNLTISGGGIKSISSGDASINGMLTFTNGIIATNSNKVIIPASGTISGAGNSKYIYGNLQKNLSAGTSISQSFEIGNAGNYLPVSVSFPNVTNSGDVTISTMDGDHPQIASSCVNPAKSVNRYWTIVNSGVAPVNFDLTLNYLASDIDAGANSANFLAAVLSGSWQNLISAVPAATSIQISGVSSFGSFQVGEVPVPSVSIASNPGSTICSGSSITFTATPVNGGALPTYQWIKNGINVGSNSPTYIDNSLVNGDVVSVNMISSSNCVANPNVSSSPVTVTVNSNPSPTITPGGPTTFCSGGSVTLTSSAGSSYLWSTGATTSSIVVSTGGSDSVTVTDVNGCQGTSVATVITVNSNPSPTITPSGPTTFCSGGSVTLTSSAGASYLWSTGATTSSIVVSTSGSESVTVTDVNGCQGTSAATVVTVNPCTFTWTGTTNTDWNTGSNWNNGLVPDNLDDATIPSGPTNMPVITALAQVNNLIISSGASLTMSNGGSLNVFGNFTNSGTFTDNGGTTAFMGSASQTLTGAVIFHNLTMNGTGGLILSSPTTVSNLLALTNGTITSGGNLTVNLNTGSIAYSSGDAGSISGNITVLKSVGSSGTHNVACPLNGVTANDFNDDTPVINPSTHKTRLFTWNCAWTTSSNQYTPISVLTTPLAPLTGYSLFFTAATTLDFTGSYNHSASYSSSNCTHIDSVNMLVGNPYPSTLDWNSASGWTKTNLDDAISYYNAATGKYASYVNGASVNGGTQYIPALQSFWLKNSSGGTSSVNINNAARVNSPVPSLWRISIPENNLRLVLKSNGFEDETLIRLRDDATGIYDGHLDAFKLLNPDDASSIYTKDLIGSTYSINSLPLEDKIIPIVIYAGAAGNYIISANNMESFTNGTIITLEDRFLNKRVILNNNSNSYSCSLNNGVNPDRFYLHIDLPGTSSINEAEVLITGFDKNVNLAFNNIQFDSKGSMIIYDIIGREVDRIENISVKSGTYSYLTALKSEGVYIVKVLIQDSVYTAKVFLR